MKYVIVVFYYTLPAGAAWQVCNRGNRKETQFGGGAAGMFVISQKKNGGVVHSMSQIFQYYSFACYFLFFQFHLYIGGGKTESAEGIIQRITCTVMSQIF